LGAGSVNLTILGLTAIVGYVVNAAAHVRRGTPEEVLWTCHLGALTSGVGLIGRWPLPVSVGVEWLVLGNVLWLAELAFGGEFLPTTLLTHVFGLMAGLAGLRILGVAHGSWRVALAAVVALWAVTWVVTPRRTRVNLVHGIRPGIDRVVPSYGVYIVLVFALCAGMFAATESVLLRLGFPGA